MNYYTAENDLFSDFPKDGTEMDFDYIRQRARAWVGSVCVGVGFGKSGFWKECDGGEEQIPLEATTRGNSKCCLLRQYMKSTTP